RRRASTPAGSMSCTRRSTRERASGCRAPPRPTRRTRPRTARWPRRGPRSATASRPRPRRAARWRWRRRVLAALVPDDLEHLLALAEEERHAVQLAAAQSTLERLRRWPPPDGDD